MLEPVVGFHKIEKLAAWNSEQAMKEGTEVCGGVFHVVIVAYARHIKLCVQ